MLQKLSISSRVSLVLWGICLSLFAIGLGGFLLYDSTTIKQRASERLEPIANLIETGIRGIKYPVQLEPRFSLNEYLANLKSSPDILAAYVFSTGESGSSPTPSAVGAVDDPSAGTSRDVAVMASYRKDQSLPPPTPKPEGVYRSGHRVELVRNLRLVPGQFPETARLHLVMQEAPLRESMRRVVMVVGAAMLVVVLGTFIQVQLLNRSVTRPLAALSALADSIRRNGNFQQRADASAHDEVGRLGHQLNEMLEAIHRRDAALQELHRLHRAILGNAAYAIFSTDARGVLTSYNPAAEKLLGWKEDAVIGRMTPADWIDPVELNQEAGGSAGVQDSTASSRFAKLLACTQTAGLSEQEWTWIRQDGSRVPVILSLRALLGTGNEVTGYVGIASDISERKQMQEKVEALARRLSLATESAGLGIWDVDLRGDRLEWDEGMLSLYCLSRPEQPPATMSDWEKFVVEEDRVLFSRRFEEAKIAGGTIAFEFRAYGPGSSKRFMELNGVVLRGQDGRAVRMIGILRDVTEKRRVADERESLIRELEAKNAELERFTYTVSHDLKSPLITVKGFAAALLRDVGAGRLDRIEPDLRRISDAADRMAQLLSNLLELSRVGRIASSMRTVRFGTVVSEVLELMAGPLNQRKVEVVVQPGLPDVVGDSQRLAQVVQNLVENSVKFMGDQAEPRIEVGHRTTTEGPVFYVRDNGVGIPARYHETIFGLFNKLDPRSPGTGIGLALVRRIIAVHGGRIWVESELGAGATFCFTLGPGNLSQQEVAA